MKKLFFSALASFVILLSFNTPALAVKYSPKTVSYLNYNQTSLNILFVNASQANTISYELIYESQGIPQGVSGSINPLGQMVVSKMITLGTCSSGTCVNHKKIKKMKLHVTYEFPGKTIVKTYTVKTK